MQSFLAPRHRRRRPLRQPVNLTHQHGHVGSAPLQTLPLQFHIAAPPVNLPQHQCGELLARRENVGEQLPAVRRRQLRRCGWRGRPLVGHVVRYRVVGLMAHARYHRDAAPENRPRHFLRIEAPQVFQRPAAPRHDDYVRQPFVIQLFDRLGNLPAGRVALYRRWRQPQFHQRIPTPRHVLNILPHRAARGRHHTDHPGKHGQRTLPRRLKQSFPRQLLPEPRQFQRHRAFAHRQHGGHLHVGFPVWRVEREIPAGQHLVTLFQVFLARPSPEHHAPDRAPVLPQAEIRMSRRYRAQVRHFALHRKPGQHPVGLKLVLQVGGHLPHGINYRRQHPESPGILIRTIRIYETRSE